MSFRKEILKCQHLSIYNSHLIFYGPPLTHMSTATLTPLLFLQNTWHAPDLKHLHGLLPHTGTPIPQISAVVTLLSPLNLCSNVILSRRPHWQPISEWPCPPLQPTCLPCYIFHNIYHFLPYYIICLTLWFIFFFCPTRQRYQSIFFPLIDFRCLGYYLTHRKHSSKFSWIMYSSGLRISKLEFQFSFVTNMS